MNKAVNFLKKSGTFYLATVEDGKPRVRPFGAISEYEGKAYLITSNQKKVFAQIQANPHVEVSGMVEGVWIRVEAELVRDDNRGAKTKVLEEYPSLKGMYNPDDDIMEVLYLKNAKATIYSFTAEPQVIEF